MIENTPARVLVDEDDDDVRDALDRGLAMHDFEVASVESAEAASSRLAGRPADVLVVDVGLPGMSGIELCSHLRSAEVDVPILILSARDAVADRVEGLQVGADDYLVKPFALTELVARLQAGGDHGAFAGGVQYVHLADIQLAIVDDIDEVTGAQGTPGNVHGAGYLAAFDGRIHI